MNKKPSNEYVALCRLHLSLRTTMAELEAALGETPTTAEIVDPVAWMTHDDPPRVASSWSRNGMHEPMKAVFCIPLYRQDAIKPDISHLTPGQLDFIGGVAKGVAMSGMSKDQFLHAFSVAWDVLRQ